MTVVMSFSGQIYSLFYAFLVHLSVRGWSYAGNSEVQRHKYIISCNYVLNLVEDAVAGGHVAGVGETHFLFIGVIQKTSLKV